MHQEMESNGDSSNQSVKSSEKIKVIIIGGSIAGLCCAHALLKTGVCRVMVLEKDRSPTSAGAGLGIDRLSCEALEHWGLRDELFRNSKPLDSEENRGIDIERKVFVTLARDDEYRHRAVHWNDLHRILYDSLPPGIAYLGHEAISLEEDRSSRSSVKVSVKVTVPEGGEAEAVKEVFGDVIVGADGAMSRTRNFYLPNEQRRYSGYCSWRGVLDCSDEPELLQTLKNFYDNLGECLYFDMARGSHVEVYELPGKRLHWLWYFNQKEPNLMGASVTAEPREETIKAMHEEADRTWMPELATLMKKTRKPFRTAIFDGEPLKQYSWRRVVLVGDAAHPTTPHGSRSTNMSIVDAFELGKAFLKWAPANVSQALTEYEKMRLQITSQQVLFSRHLGRLKQGLLFEPRGSFPWSRADDALVEGLLQKNMQYFQGGR